ncbi:MAG: hypothetical protein IH988_05570 [Planctomycetes bacterium]|nr:hypothetical protein [Planctomycetota bacterium]
MPRPNKAIRRQKINAAIAWKRGDRKEAWTLWDKADKARKELQAKKLPKKPEPEAETETSKPDAAGA